jgi:hypothetical protein
VGIGGGKTATDPRITTATIFFQFFEIEVQKKKKRKGLTMYLINQDDSRRKILGLRFLWRVGNLAHHVKKKGDTFRRMGK